MSGRLLSFAVALGLALSVLPAWAEYRSKGKRDPMVPLLNSEGQRIHPPGLDEETATGVSGLILQGIVFDSKAESYAIINGEIVREQDEIEGMKVVKINPNAVTILAEGQTHDLAIRQMENPPAAPEDSTEDIRGR